MTKNSTNQQVGGFNIKPTSMGTKQKTNDTVKLKGGTRLKKKIKKKNNNKPKTQRFKEPSTTKEFKNYAIKQEGRLKSLKDWKKQCGMHTIRKEVDSMKTAIHYMEDKIYDWFVKAKPDIKKFGK